MTAARRLTRRDVLTGVAAAGAGLLVGPAGARAAAGPGLRRGFSHSVGSLPGGVATTIVSRRPFCLAAVRWAAPEHVRLELRTRRADGRWGPWAVASSGGHEGDGVRPRGHVGEGVWTGFATELALRAGAPVRGVVVDFVAAEVLGVQTPAPGAVASAASAASAADTLPLAAPDLPAGPGQPSIIARTAWAGDDHPPVSGPFYGSIQMGIVHHTENPNGYTPAEVPAMIRAIYEFHVHGRGWWDIGYNFVVDHFGRIWEARQGGIDLPVIGAQAGDWNEISFGVSMLGTYTDVVPSPAALAALERLLAWKMALNGLPVIGEISEVVAAEGVSWTQFRVGERVRFPRIAGHRDVDSTECPGDALDRYLPVMRPRVKALAGSPPTLALTGEITYFTGGPSLVLTGRLAAADDTPIGDAPVVIETVVGRFGRTRTVAAGTTTADGRFTTTVIPHRGELLRAVHPDRPAAVSELLQVQALG